MRENLCGTIFPYSLLAPSKFRDSGFRQRFKKSETRGVQEWRVEAGRASGSRASSRYVV